MMNVVVHYKSHTICYLKVVKVLIIDNELRFSNAEDDEIFICFDDNELDFITIDKCRLEDNYA